MVEIRPFRAIRYTGEAGDLGALITQPYDKITPQMQKKYYSKSPNNFCRVILPAEEDRYNAARANLDGFLSGHVMEKDQRPGIYVYFQDFEVSGRKYLRKGFICALRLEPYEEKVVLPHEQTHKGPKIDRLNMWRATRTDTEPGFILYPDPRREVARVLDEASRGRPLMEVLDEDGVRNRLWKLEDQSSIRRMRAALSGEQVVIADGHHRYETAIAFRDELRAANPGSGPNEAFNFRMTYMVDVEDPGLVVLSGHRLLLKQALTGKHIAELRKHFDITQMGKDAAPAFLEKNRDRVCFAAYTGKGKCLGLVLKGVDAVAKFFKPEYSAEYRRLDVVVLRDIVFEGIMKAGELKIDEDIGYSRWIPDALEKVDSGKAKVAFLLNATRPAQVLSVSRNGERMPEKSTDFYPKMMSGLTMMDLRPGERIPG
ncbi:MAG: DUF1015 domain-containing protein [Euryarchaeota archaeon]|nr:DUF1015 domain-containing protein [Euryarchaeota archaeon]